MTENINVYDFINDIQQDLTEYDNLPVSEKELMNWEKRFYRHRFNRINKIRRAYKWMTVAAASMIIMALALTNVQVRAGVIMTIYHIQDILGMEAYITDYSVPINKVIESEEMSIAIGDVILDKQNLYVIYSCIEGDNGSNLAIAVELTINGKSVNSSSASHIYNTENAAVYISEIHVPYINMDKEYLYRLNFNVTKADGSIDEIGDIYFISSADYLMGNTEYSEINKTIVIDNEYELILENYYSNYIKQEIVAKIINDEIKKYDIVLKGKDNLGRPMTFYLSEVYDDIANFRLLYENQEETLVDLSGVDSFEVTAYYIKRYQYSNNSSFELLSTGEQFVIYVR